MSSVKTGRTKLVSFGNLIPGFVFLGLFLTPFNSSATTAGVPGATLRPHDRAFDYRVSSAHDTLPATLDHRFHYQHSLAARFRVRGILAFRDAAGSSIELNWSRLELQWQLRTLKNGADGLRFDLQRSDQSNRADFVRVAYFRSGNIGSTAYRINLFAGKENGAAARDGATLAVRTELSWKVGDMKLEIGRAHV